MNNLRISVITPVYNRASVIAQAIESVRRQNPQPYEHIVIDGASTDGTLDVLSAYGHLQVVSRPDQGMYFAINDGLRLSSGEIIGILNSDDIYLPGVLAAVKAAWDDDTVAVAAQAIYFVEDEGKRRFFWPTKPLTSENFWRELTYGDPAFNAWFFHRTVFEQIGWLDTSYHIAGDRDFLLRFALAGMRPKVIHKTLYAYRVHASSLSLSTEKKQFLLVMDEIWRWADTYEHRLPDEGKKYLQRARVRDTITAALRSLQMRDWQRAYRYARMGWGYQPLWPVLFGWRVLGGIFRMLGRRLKILPPV